MIAALTLDDAQAVLRAHLDRSWLEAAMATPEGRVVMLALCDLFVALDEKDLRDAQSLYLAPSSRALSGLASGAGYATATVRMRLRRQLRLTGASLVVPTGTRVSTRDGRVFRTTAPRVFAQGEVGAWRSVDVVAEEPGHRGWIPAGEIDRFVPVARGVTGIGTDVSLVGITPTVKALRFTTDTEVPHPFGAEFVGLYLELLDVDNPAAAGNVGRLVSLGYVSDAAGAPPGAPDPGGSSAYAWSGFVDTALDARYAAWTTGSFGYTWAVRDWADLGLEVEGITDAAQAREAVLDQLARDRGRPREVGEDDEQVRARLARRPEPPTPLGALRKALVAGTPYGLGRLDLRIYELGQPGPDASDPYGPNFPAAMGFIVGLHSCSMTTPETPDGMASRAPDYTLLAPWSNPGLALLRPAAGRWTALLRWEPPGTMSADRVATIRRLLFSAFKQARQPGCFVQLYEPTQWGYP